MNAGSPLEIQPVDPRVALALAPLTRLQMIAIAITVSLNALDGFDVLAITFALPGIGAEWGMGKAQLGIVISAGLLGMGLGSIALGSLSDIFGRKPMIVFSLVLMTAGMLLTARARGVVELGIWRLLTGLGIGSMLAAINALSGEMANERRRDLAVSVMNAGYSIGGLGGGAVAALLLQHHSWRSIFYVGSVGTSVFVPLVLFAVPESVQYLIARQPRNALQRTNKSLRRLGLGAVTALPQKAAQIDKISLLQLFGRGLRRTTFVLIAAYLLIVSSAYYMLGWIPQIVASLGFPAATAATVSLSASIGGLVGSVLLGAMSARIGVTRLAIISMTVAGLMIVLFGRSPPELVYLRTVAAVTGFFLLGSVVLLYSVIARAFGPSLRATGVGFVIGIGRAGAVISPALAGFLFASGVSLAGVSALMGAGALVGAAALALLN